LLYTITGADNLEVEAVSSLITPAMIDTLTADDIEGFLSAGMSIAVYNVEENRVAYVWSISDTGSISYTKYFYDAAGKLSFTISGSDKVAVEAVTDITLDNIASLTSAQVEYYLGNEMSLAVYDTDNERIDHIWSKNDAGEASYTQYYYDDLGKLVYTITGPSETLVRNVTITPETVDTLTATDIDNLLRAGMSIAVYDTVNDRVEYVWSRDNDGTTTFTQYNYNTNGELTYTITGANRAEVESVGGQINVDITTITTEFVDGLLLAGMSIAIYDLGENRVDHVWARSDTGDLSFTQYFYNDLGRISYTVSGSDRASVETAVNALPQDVSTLSVTDVESLLGAGMSIAVYDTENNRIDHVWSRNDSGDISFTQYGYNTDGDLVYTVTGSDRVEVAATVSGIDLATISTLDETTAASLLNAGMSLVVYDIDAERIDHTWSVSDENDLTFTQYTYDASNDKLFYTVSGSSRSDVEGLSGLDVLFVNNLNASEVESYFADGISMAVYGVDGDRVDFVWSKSDTGEVSYTDYVYNDNGELAYTITGRDIMDVTEFPAIDPNDVASLTDEFLEANLSAGMSLAVYDIDNNRIDHIWSCDDTGDVTFTQYVYDSLDNLVYTISGETRADVEAVGVIDTATVADLSNADIETLLSAGMSLVVYDIDNNQIDHIWSVSDRGDISFSAYIYNEDGELAYTLTGDTRY